MKKKSPPPQKKSFYLHSVQLFSVDAKMFSIFFPQNDEKTALNNRAHNCPPIFFFMYWPGSINQSRIDFSCHKYVPRRICSLICEPKCATLEMKAMLRPEVQDVLDYMEPGVSNKRKGQDIINAYSWLRNILKKGIEVVKYHV